MDLLDRPELLPRVMDAYATSTVDVLGRPSVCLVGTADGPMVVWSALGEYEEWMAGALAGPCFALLLEPPSGHFHVGQPALVRVGAQLHLVAELRPEVLASAKELAAALDAYLERQSRAHDLVTAARGY
ncbi:hypothetical protein ACWGB8_18965 [Kitasatospora sp. NPDC054939]